MGARTRALRVGGVAVGGGAPVSVQTMLTADPHDLEALHAQAERCAKAGAEIVRLTVPDLEAARVLGKLKERTRVPLVADVHFDARCAVAALEAGADALRVNPGNIGGREKVALVARAAKARGAPVRVGVNGGSLEKDLLAKHGGPSAGALVESALRHAAMLEAEGFGEIAVSVKASDAMRTVEAYRALAAAADYPLHVGVTEAGTLLPGTVRSSVAMALLLSEGIGDTLRVSLTAPPETEVKAGLEILRALGLREPGFAVTSCPTCGRTKADVMKTAADVEAALDALLASGWRPSGRMPRVAVMGCVVNGPGEAAEADVALCGGNGDFILYAGGKPAGKVGADEAVAAAVAAAARFGSKGEAGENVD